MHDGTNSIWAKRSSNGVQSAVLSCGLGSAYSLASIVVLLKVVEKNNWTEWDSHNTHTSVTA